VYTRKNILYNKDFFYALFTVQFSLLYIETLVERRDLNPKSFLAKYTITRSTVVIVCSFICLFISTKSDVPFYVKQLTAMRLRLSPKFIQRQLPFPLTPRPHADHSPLLSTVWPALSALFDTPSTRKPTCALQDCVCSSCSIEQISLKISMSW
jgi:hypothetical protein